MRAALIAVGLVMISGCAGLKSNHCDSCEAPAPVAADCGTVMPSSQESSFFGQFRLSRLWNRDEDVRSVAVDDRDVLKR